MEELSRQRNIESLDAMLEAQDGFKMRLDDLDAVSQSVLHLRNHGFHPGEIQDCLVRYFYVDLDILSDVLSTR